jgi:hypothetical protein
MHIFVSGSSFRVLYIFKKIVRTPNRAKSIIYFWLLRIHYIAIKTSSQSNISKTMLYETSPFFNGSEVSYFLVFFTMS